MSQDIIVIGGGIAGISAAAELARSAKVTVIEAEPQIGYHATGRSAAIFIRNYGNAVLRALNAAAYPVLNGDASGDSVLSPRGEVMLAREEDLPVLEAYLEGSTGIERLTAAEATELVPVLRTDQIAAAMLEQDAQGIDVDRLLQGYARQVRACGGSIETGGRVTAITRDGTGWRVEVGGKVLNAGIVVNAAGGWADQVAQMAGLRTVGLVPKRRSAVIMALPAGVDPDGWPLFGSIAETWYAKPEAGRLMISPADEDPVEPGDIHADDMVLAEGLDRFSQMVDVPLVRPSHSWAGMRSFVADKTPVVGMDPDAPGFFWLAGQGGYGVQTSPALAGLTAALCLGETPALAADVVTALAPDRLRQ